MKKRLKVGFDFDGVVAYNPFRLFRAPWAFFKSHFLGIEKLTFFYPKANWQRVFWRVIHDSSIFPARGVGLLKELVEEKKIEAHLITGRFRFLDSHLRNWLKKYQLEKVFQTLNINLEDEQPHLFKEKMLKKFKLDIFIEDNWDIVEYLSQKEKETKIYWIYNLIDRFRPYPFKFPYLEKALEEMVRRLSLSTQENPKIS